MNLYNIVVSNDDDEKSFRPSTIALIEADDVIQLPSEPCAVRADGVRVEFWQPVLIVKYQKESENAKGK